MNSDHLQIDMFERSVASFFGSCMSLKANESAFQAWCSTFVMEQSGIDRVYREIHLDSKLLVQSAPILTQHLKQRGNEFFPDIAVARRPNLDARHSSTRDPHLHHPRAMLEQLSIVAEFKVTGSTLNPTSPKAIRTDLFKRGAMSESLGSNPGPATYLIVLDSFARDGQAKPHYTPKRMASQVISKAENLWPPHVAKPTILVGSPSPEGPSRSHTATSQAYPRRLPSGCPSPAVSG